MLALARLGLLAALATLVLATGCASMAPPKVEVADTRPPTGRTGGMSGRKTAAGQEIALVRGPRATRYEVTFLG